MAETVGRVIAGRYRLMRLLGEGGMGSAWQAFDERMRREVAVKQLKLPEGVSAGARAELVARMAREARAAGMLNHRGIITVHDQFTDERGMPWIVMELVPGRSLEQVVAQDGRLPVPRVAQIGAQVAEALMVAHAAGVVHRDIKPSNILLDGDRVVLTDFGIAAVDGSTTLTPTGALIGTPAYMAPEQVNGRGATSASDMWSLGVTLYTAVEGRQAFIADGIAALLLAVSRGRPAPMVHAGALRPVVDALMSMNPTRRPSAVQAAKRLHQVHHKPSAASPPPAPSAPTPGPPPPIDSYRPGTLTRRRVLLVLGTAGLVTAVPVTWFALGEDTPSLIGKPLNANAGSVKAIAFAPDGKTLVSAHRNGTLRLWNVAARTLVGLPFVGHTAEVRAASFSPDGKILASGSADKTVRLWEVVGHTPIGGPLTGHTDWVYSVAFSPDGKTLATGSIGDTVRLWNVATRTPIGQLPAGDGSAFYSVVFSPDGKTLASAGNDLTVRLWSVAARTLIGQPLGGHANTINSIAFSPDGKTLASASSDETVRLWNVDTQAPIGRPLTGHTEMVQDVAFSPDGKTLASASMDGTVRLWDSASHKLIDRLTGHTGAVQAVAFSPDSKILASASADSTIRLWKL